MEIVPIVSTELNLTHDETKQMLPSGKQIVIRNRIGWAMTYLKQARLLETPSRGLYKITPRGLQALAVDVDIDNKYLSQFKEFIEFKERSR